VIDEPVLDPQTGRHESPYDPADVALVRGAGAALRSLAAAGFRLVVVSNQPAAAKERSTREALDAVHARIVELLAAEGVRIDDWRYCFHHPDFTGPCTCRKPEPGLLLDAARELGLDLGASWLVGDADRDVEAGRRAGCRTVLVENPRSAHRRAGAAADAVAPHLTAAVAVILRG
jgi:D-glycero-D-manno-heptose 1,7-bisphosphate phosphatase